MIQRKMNGKTRIVYLFPITVTTTTKVTGKGQIYFVDKFLGKDVA